MKRKGVLTMLRKFFIVAAVILLFTSGTLADIGQVECFSIGSLNIVGRRGPVGSAKGGNLVVFSHSQKIQKPWFSTKLKQEEKGILVQYGTAQGTGGVSGNKGIRPARQGHIIKIRKRRRTIPHPKIRVAVKVPFEHLLP